MLAGKVTAIPGGVRGIDTNEAITPVTAMALSQRGYHYVFRYIRQHQTNSYDLSVQEASIILSTDLGLGIVQHVESETAWVPSAVKGIAFGKTAGQEGQRLGVPAQSQIWCDLEGVLAGTDHKSVIEYLKWWFDGVANAGFDPGLYVGWHCGLTADELYHDIPFTRYWRSFNLNDDEVPAVRGTCLRQYAATTVDRMRLTIDFDVDLATTDALGGQATVIAPAGWSDSLTG